MPLLVRHFDMPLDRITVVDADDHSAEIAPYRKLGVNYVLKPVTPDNMAEVLETHVGTGGLVLNLSVDVSSIAVMNWCRTHGTLYLDTCIEPWGGYYNNPRLP